MTTGVVLSGIGMHQVQPDSIQITVKAYLFPCVLGGGVEFPNQIHGYEIHGCSRSLKSSFVILG